MKNILALFALIFLTSCEDVVDIDLDTAAPKLVIDANILWLKGTAGNEQRIKLSTTTGFYSTEIPSVSNATVFITNSNATVFTFTEIVPNTGEYICTNFVPVVNENYTLTVIVNGVTYTATQTLLATPDIDYVEQTTVQGIGGDLLQVKFFFQDNGLEDNNYLIIVKKSDEVIPELGSISDEFFQGNQMFGFYSDDELEAGDQLTFGLQSMTLRYYNYMNKLINIVGSTGNPFATPPATLRGNIINQTDSNNYPLGYFHMSEVDTEEYTIQ